MMTVTKNHWRGGGVVSLGRGRGCGVVRAYQDDFSADDGAVEGGDAAGGLAVVVWKAEEEHEPDGPEEDGKGGCDTRQCRAVRY